MVNDMEQTFLLAIAWVLSIAGFLLLAVSLTRLAYDAVKIIKRHFTSSSDNLALRKEKVT